MSSFFDILHSVETELNDILDESIIHCEQMGELKEYGSFLNYIPVERQTRVARKIVLWFYNHNSDCDFYNFFYEPLKEERCATKQTIVDAEMSIKSEEKLLAKVRLGKDKSKKRQSDIKKAKAFRTTLRNFEEMYKHLGASKLNDIEKRGYRDKPYFDMVDLIDEYIQDLETKKYKMAHELDYSNTPKIKTNKKELSKYLKRLKKLYDLPCNDVDITMIVKNIYSPKLKSK